MTTFTRKPQPSDQVKRVSSWKLACHLELGIAGDPPFRKARSDYPESKKAQVYWIPDLDFVSSGMTIIFVFRLY